MVLAYHLIFTAYGFWLPNDPRGSWSDFVWAWELRRFGPATRTHERRSLAFEPHDYALRMQAKEALKYPAVVFDGVQAAIIGKSFAATSQARGYRIFACSILPEHVHMVVGRHQYHVEQVMRVFKQDATEALTRAGVHPLGRFSEEGKPPTPWTRKGWKVFLDEPEDILRARRYVEENPIKEGKRPQSWSFVIPYHGPFHDAPRYSTAPVNPHV
jgi:REP element-mobilizing transposase RayT